MEKHPEQIIPAMSQIPDIDDRIRILFGILPEGEEIIIHEEEEKDK